MQRHTSYPGSFSSFLPPSSSFSVAHWLTREQPLILTGNTKLTHMFRTKNNPPENYPTDDQENNQSAVPPSNTSLATFGWTTTTKPQESRSWALAVVVPT